MEALGAVASAAQLATAINSIIQLVLEVCDELRAGSRRIRERLQYLDSLVNILRLIRNNVSLQCVEVSSQLEAISSKVSLLVSCLHKNSQASPKKSLRRVWGAFLSVRDEDTICETLLAIEYDKNSLILSITAISAETTYHIARWDLTRMCFGGSVGKTKREPDEDVSSIVLPVQASSADTGQVATRGHSQAISTSNQQRPLHTDAQTAPADSQNPGYSNSSTARESPSQPQTTAPQSPAAIYAARIATDRQGDITLGDVTVERFGTFTRGNIINAQQAQERSRVFAGNVNVGEQAFLADQNSGYAADAWRQRNATQLNANRPEDARR